MKIAVTGSRALNDKPWVFAQLDNVLTEIQAKYKLKHPPAILSGGALGVDTLSREWSEEKGLDFVLFKPYHLVDNKVEFETKYFFSRNRQLVDNADVVVCLWNGVSHGTQHVMKYAEKKGKKLVIVQR